MNKKKQNEADLTIVLDSDSSDQEDVSDLYTRAINYVANQKDSKTLSNTDVNSGNASSIEERINTSSKGWSRHKRKCNRNRDEDYE